MLDDHLLFTVTDLKQYSYCPRVIFYEKCLPHIRPRTYKMDAGRDEHEDEEKRAARRNLSKYAVVEGERRFNISIASTELGLTGTLDEVVYTAQGEIIPVDYKLTRKVSPNHRLQLAAYAILLGTIAERPVRRGFVYLILTRKAVEVQLTDKLRDSVYTTLKHMQNTVSKEIMPIGTTNRNSCFACEFRRFCNDV